VFGATQDLPDLPHHANDPLSTSKFIEDDIDPSLPLGISEKARR